MSKVICFIGVVEEIEVPEGTSEPKIAAMAREKVMKRLNEGKGYSEHDFGVEIVGPAYE